MPETPTSSRRAILRTGAGLASVGTLGPVALEEASGAETSAGPIPTTAEEIRAAFDGIRKNDDPTDFEREVARSRFPETAVPESGPVPDPVDRVEVQLEAPPWALATAFDKMRWTVERGDNPDELSVVDVLIENVQAYEGWVLPDGRDAVPAILKAANDER